MSTLATRKWFVPGLLAALVMMLIASSAYILRNNDFGSKTITAYFTSAQAVYPGDEVRVAGVKVGKIKAIEPDGTEAKMTLIVDNDVPVPADAKAVLVAQNLISARYVQLTPAYGADDAVGGPTMSDGAVIPLERTAIPVEWDDVKKHLMKLASDLGPTGASPSTSVAQFIDSAANAMDGNGDKLRDTMKQLSGISRVLADGSGNIVDIIKNLQLFLGALRDSNTQIVQFQDRLATLTSVIDGSRSDLDAALTNLSEAVGEVQRFVAGSRDQTAEQIQRLGVVTRNIADNQMALKNVLHIAPTAFANGYNIYNPDSGTAMGGFALANFSNPVQLVCSSIAAVKNATAAETAKLCAQYLGPALGLLNFNYLPFPFNAYLAKSPSNVTYSDPALAPGGGGPTPQLPGIPPSVSAYTGAGDMPPPPGWSDPAHPAGVYAPNGLPADPQPALFPGAPVPPGVPAAPVPPPVSRPANLQELLLPAEVPPAPQPAEGNP